MIQKEFQPAKIQLYCFNYSLLQQEYEKDLQMSFQPADDSPSSFGFSFF